MYIVCAITSVGVYIIVDYIRIFFIGYTPSDWIGNSLGRTYYGLDAIKNADWENMFYIPYLIFNGIVLIAYNLYIKSKYKYE